VENGGKGLNETEGPKMAFLAFHLRAGYQQQPRGKKRFKIPTVIRGRGGRVRPIGRSTKRVKKEKKP